MADLSHRQQFPTRLMTAEEFAQRDPDTREELVRGRVVPLVAPKPLHGVIAAKITARLVSFVEAHDLGYVLAESGYILERGPDTVRSPDVAFLSFTRLPGRTLPEHWPELAPDLVVEVISPSERPRYVREKVGHWFGAGARRVWLLYPRSRSVYVLRSPADVQILGPDDTLSGDDVLPGFSCPVAALL